MKERIERRDFAECKGIWIPAEILFNNDLSWLEKHLVVDIYNLETADRGCFKGNASFAAFHRVGVSAIEKALTRLRRLGFIYTESFDGRHRTLRVNPQKYFGSRPGKNSGADSEEITRLSRKNFRPNWNEKPVQDIKGEQDGFPREAGKEKNNNSSRRSTVSPSAEPEAAASASESPSAQAGAAAPGTPAGDADAASKQPSPASKAQFLIQGYKRYGTAAGIPTSVTPRDRQALEVFFEDNPEISSRHLLAIMIYAWTRKPEAGKDGTEPYWYCLNKSRRIGTCMKFLTEIQDELEWKGDEEWVEDVFQKAERRFFQRGVRVRS